MPVAEPLNFVPLQFLDYFYADLPAENSFITVLMSMDKIHYTRCPLCGKDNLETFLTTEDFLKTHESFDIVKCAECGFVFTQDVPQEEVAGGYYESENYISHSDIRRGLINRLYHRVRQYMLRRKWKLVSHLTAGRKLLDIGCGTGYFPAFMQKKGYISYYLFL